MEDQEDFKKTLSDIRNLMDGSARFHSVSGLAGVCSGLAALAGIAVFYLHFGFGLFDPFLFVTYRTVPFLMFDGLAVLLVSLVFALYFTQRNASRKGEKIWNRLSRRVLIYWSIPMAAGGLILLPYFGGSGPILFPAAIALSLVFYGLALVSASRFSLNELFWLGLLDILLGLLAYFFWQYSLLLWALGFGLMNIIFGLAVYMKHERQQK